MLLPFECILDVLAGFLMLFVRYLDFPPNVLDQGETLRVFIQDQVSV